MSKNKLSHIPLLKHFGTSKDDIKLTFDTLVKFMNDIRHIKPKYTNYDNVDDDIDDDIADDNVDTDNKNTNSDKSISYIKKETQTLKFGDISELKNLKPNLTNIFKSHMSIMLHCGIIDRVQNLKKINNISLISSILTSLMGNFCNKSETEQAIYIKCQYEFIIKNIYGDTFEKFDYKKYKWNIKEVYDEITILAPSVRVLRIIADIMHINIFLLDNKEDKLKYIGTDYFVPFKKNIFLLMHENNIIEPIFFKESKYLQVNSPILQYLILNPHFVHTCNFNKLPDDVTIFKIQEEDLSKYLVVKPIKLNYKEKILYRQLGIKIQPDIVISTKADPKADLKVDPKPDLETDPKVDINASEINAFTECDNDDEGNVSDLESDPQTLKKTKTEQVSKHNKKDLSAKKILDIQTIAKSYNIPIISGTSKNGKDKMKAKSVLIDEIMKLQKN
jgi:hypothetical protein